MMKINVLDLFLKRMKMAFSVMENDEWIAEAIREDKESFAIILTDNALNRFKDENVICLREKYKLSGMFDLKNPFANTNINMFLYCFEKNYSGTLKYGIYRNTIKGKTSHAYKYIAPYDEYPESYFSYIEKVERFIEYGILPEDNEIFEFGYLNPNIRDENLWNPNRYSKKVLAVKEGLKSEKTVLLDELAAIIIPRPNFDIKSKYCVNQQNWKYPADYDNLREGPSTNSPLKKGDIIISDFKTPIFIYEEPQYEIHASPNSLIIRPNTINPEYLFLYLKSNTAEIIFESMKSGHIIGRVKRADLCAFPIILPKDKIESYREIFITKYFPVQSMQRILASMNSIQLSNSNGIENILKKELVDNLKAYKQEAIKKFLSEDLEELNVCFKNKAYKATLILAGSILEAVLIDWVSEIHQKDYFKEDFITRSGKPAVLSDYIKEIKYLKHPDWAVEADKAHLIREKRNLVHAKLCMKSDEINEDVCKRVIQYLQEVLETRNGKMRKYNRK